MPQVRDRRGNLNTYVHDDNGWVLSETNALGETTTHTYDADGSELTRTDGEGHTTTWTYDARGNALTVYTHADPVNNVDPSGQLTIGEFMTAVAINATIGAVIAGGINYYKTGDIEQAVEAAGIGAITGAFLGAVFQGVKALVAYRLANAGVAARATAAIADDVVITQDKLRYLLVLDPGKAKGFEIFGYTNPAALEKMLAASRSLVETAKVTSTEYGTKYLVAMEVVGPSGVKGVIEVVWQVDRGTSVYRLITAIPHPFK